MSSKTIVVIVAVAAVVLALAAPAAVEAQTPTLTVAENLFGFHQVNYSGFSASAAYYGGLCYHASAHPASCAFDSSGNLANGVCFGVAKEATNSNTSGTFLAASAMATGTSEGAYLRTAAYSGANCQTEVAAVTYTRPTTPPAWVARDVTHDSAAIRIEDDFSTHGVRYWSYELTPGEGCTRVGSTWAAESPTSSLAGLSAHTTYTYTIWTSCSRTPNHSPVASVTFTTDLPPAPAPPTGVEVTPTTDGSGSVTFSWENPGDPDIASYEYYLRRSGGRGEWRTVAGSDADTTSMTIDLTTGEAVAGNARGVTPTVEWTVYLRARGVNGASSRATEITFTTLGSASEPETPEETPETPEETPGSVPALPLAGLVTLAVVLFLGGQRKAGRSSGGG